MIYLDNAATSPLHPNALKAMQDAYANWANPASMHKIGKQNFYALKQLREQFKEIFSIPESAIVIFTSCGTESNNLLLHSTKLPVVATFAEHPSIKNFPNVRLIDLSQLEDVLKTGPHLISLSSVQNETGICVDFLEVGALAKKYNSKLHLDASQDKNISFACMNADYLTISSHKIGGPIGVAALVSKTLLDCLFFGGKQEENMRSGTSALPLIAGFVAAAECRHNYAELKHALTEQIADKFFLENNVKAKFAEHIIAFYSPLHLASEIFAFLDCHDIAVSLGSACQSGTIDGMQSLKYLNLKPEHGFRVSLGWQNTIAEMQKFAVILNKYI